MSDNQITPVQIADRTIGPGHPCFVIGEAGLNHNGDMGLAKQLIDSAAAAGCDCVKFQRRTVSELAVKEVLDAEDARFPSLGRTYREIRERHEFDAEQIRELIDYAASKNLIWMCTPFDIPAAEFLEQFDPPAYKIASHSVTNIALIEKMAEIGKPAFMSSGMCSLEEIDVAVNTFANRGTPLILLHCVSAYPTPADQQNMRMIEVLRERYHLPIGYSGHEIGMLPTLVSIAMGACVVERHITTDTKLEGFDHKLSLSPDQLGTMISEIRSIEKMLGRGEKFVTDVEQVTRDKYRVSIASSQSIKAGDTISEDMICFKNPGTGLSPSQRDLVIGSRAVVDIPQDVLISLDMINV